MKRVKRVKKVFLSGIAGTGMSALAGLFHESGFEVSGSDTRFYPPVGEILVDMGVTLHTGYRAENIPADVDLCVIGNIISRGNPEAEHILNHDLEYCSMAEALWRFFIKGRRSIVVAGTHGKTTTSAFVSFLLHRAGREPGFFIGGKPLDFPANYRLSAGGVFVSEGDEYETAFFDRSPKFLKYHPHVLLLTALEHDHLDIYASEEAYLKGFSNLLSQVPSQGVVIANADYPQNLRIIRQSPAPVLTYGAGEADYRIGEISVKGTGTAFTLTSARESSRYFSPLPGGYNAWNLASGIVLGHHLGIPGSLITGAVADFRGVERRLQCIRKIYGTLFFEDFAHHPTAVKAVIASLRELYPDRWLTVLFEPRSWSLRRRFFQHMLPSSFAAADEVVFKEVFEKEKIPEADRLDLSQVIRALADTGKKAHLFGEYDEIRKWLEGCNLDRSQVILLLSNGDFGGIPGFIRSLGRKKEAVQASMGRT